MASRTVLLRGRGSTVLSPATHVATGGEASIYRSSDLVVKIYKDPNKMERDRLVDKVDLLRQIVHPTIVAPLGVVEDGRGRPVGLYTHYVEGEALPRVFTTSYWRRISFTVENATRLVSRMRETVACAHAGGAVMVDANELNWIVVPDPDPRIIDVDSWSVGSWKPTVIMPSIRDWHSTSFDERSDWFSWAVVTFQIYVGIHPYRGSLDGYSLSQWQDRMRDNASVFSPGARLPAAARDVSTIPGRLLAWYEAVFQHGERSVPPSPRDASTSTPPAIVRRHVAGTVSGASIVVEKLFDSRPVRRAWPCGAVLVDGRRGHLEVWNASTKRKLFDASSPDVEIIGVPGGFLLTEVVARKIWSEYAPETGGSPVPVAVDLACRSLFRCGERLFAVRQDRLTELAFIHLKTPVLAVEHEISTMYPHSTQWFDGVGVERAMGSAFVLLTVGEFGFATTRVPELDDLRVVSARGGRHYAVFTATDASGSPVKLEITFGDDHASYEAWSVGTHTTDLNAVILPRGVCATIVRDGELVIYVPSNKKLSRVTDPGISTASELANFGNTVVWIDRGVLFSVRTK